MAHVISFRTGMFDPASEPENPFNPIAGQSALVWLRESVLEDAHEPTEPEAEDWGWYIEVQDDEASYTVGSICFDEDEQPADGKWDWMIQVVKHRKPSDVLFRRHAMTPDDRMTRIITDALEVDPAFEQVSVEHGR